MPLRLLSLAGPAPDGGQRALRNAAAFPPPAIPGLLARSWFAVRGQLCGHYLFKAEADETSLEDAQQEDPCLAAMGGDRVLLRSELHDIEAAGLFDRPIFIIAGPRSGSTLLFERLRVVEGLWSIDAEAHGPIEGIASLHPSSRGFTSHRLTDIDATPAIAEALKAGLAARLVDQERRSWLSFPSRNRPQRLRIVEKTPENVLRIPFLSTIFPDARFIFLFRDARASVSSLIEAWNHGGFVNLPDLPGWRRGPWCFLLPAGWEQMAERPIGEVCAFQWAEANRQALDDLETLDPGRWMAVDYDEMVATPLHLARRIAHFADFDEGALLKAFAPPLALSATTVSPPSSIKWRSKSAFDARFVAPYRGVAARLRHLIEQSPSPEARLKDPGVRFACLLSGLQPLADSGQDEIVDPSLLVQSRSSPPLEVLRRTGPRTRFLGDRPILWISDPSTEILEGYWADLRDTGSLLRLVPGIAPPPLPGRLAGLLRAAGVLTSTDALNERRRRGLELVRQGCRELRDERFAALGLVLSELQRTALADYYRRLVATGEWSLGDAQVERRFGLYNEPVASSFHHQLTKFVSAIAAEPLKPSYCYVSAYQGGAVLRPHVDRLQCDITVSLVVDANEEAAEWPLWLMGGGGPSPVRLGAGDAVIFRGCELPHWRFEGSNNARATMLLLHYVASSFQGVLG